MFTQSTSLACSAHSELRQSAEKPLSLGIASSRRVVSSQIEQSRHGLTYSARTAQRVAAALQDDVLYPTCSGPKSDSPPQSVIISDRTKRLVCSRMNNTSEELPIEARTQSTCDRTDDDASTT